MIARGGRALAVVAAGLLMLLGHAAAQTEITSIEELRAAAASGGTYRLASGTLFIDEPIQVTGDLTLTGASRESSLLVVRGSEAGLVVREGARLVLTRASIDGGSPEAAGGADLIQVHGGYLGLFGVTLTGARSGASPAKIYGLGSAVLLTGQATARIVASIIESNDLVAVETHDSAGLVLTGSIVKDNRNGVFAEGVASLDLDGNEISNHGGVAVVVRGDATATLTRNLITSNGWMPDGVGAAFDAMRVTGNAVVTLNSNSFVDNPRFALSLSEQASAIANGNIYSGNGGLSVFDDYIYSALLVEDDTSYVGTGDVFSDNPGGAIEVDEAGRLELEDASFTGTGSYASLYFDDDADVRLVNTIIEGSEGAVMVLGRAKLEVIGGTFATSEGHAFELLGGTTIIREAAIRDNRGSAVRAAFDAIVNVSHNVVRDNRAGLVFLDRARAYVEGNSLSGNATNAIAFGDLSGGVVVDNDVVHASSSGDAIHVGAQSVVTQSGNTVRAP